MTAAAFAIGLSLSAPGVALADSGDTEATPANQSTEQSDRPVRTAGVPARSARGAAARAAQTEGPAATPAEVTNAEDASQAPDSAAPAATTPRSNARRSAAVDLSRPPGDPHDAIRTTPGWNGLHQSTRLKAVRGADATTEIIESWTQKAEPTPSIPAPLTSEPPDSTALDATPPTAAATPAGLTVAAIPTAVATGTTDWLSELLTPVQSFFEGIALLVRRTFFNQAPTVTPVQTTGQLIGPITGTVGAIDPEGDPLIYAVTVAPRYGTVALSADGGYVYTPGADFTGLDSFNVAVTDAGFHLNLLDPSRPISTEAFLQVAQNATVPMLTFSFVYGSGSQHWSAAARGALQDAAMMLAMYVAVASPTTIVYDVTGENSPSSSTLASAGSDLVAPGAGFFATVVQQKIQSGVDANGSAADGDITFNFGNPWGFGTSVGRNQYDFTSTAIHELLHTFGFLSYTEEPGANSGRSWTTFDRFLMTADGTNVISNSYRWIGAYNATLTGGLGGLFFGGPNAVAAYGGPVPLYTPDPWEYGSSVTHLDDDTFIGVGTMLMNAVTDTGPGVRVLSPVELAILKDLGYTVYESGPLQALILIGFGFLRRRPAAQRPVS